MNSIYTVSTDKLINGCIKGDRNSQKELYNIYAEKMFSICLRYAKDQMDAEDILQEGFIKLFNNLDKFRGEGSFDGWVRRIFVNTAIESIRRKNRNILNGEGFENIIIDPQSNVLDRLYEKDLINCSKTLSIGYKTIFNLYAIEGYSHKEIASQLGISESTSKSQFSRAKSLLRNIIQFKNPKKTTSSVI
jgi:RNA polymerase sigma-70 factor (ECF subfamily)